MKWCLIKRALRKKPLWRLWQKNVRTKKSPPCSMLEVYDETTIFIPVEIMEDVVGSVAQKLSRNLVPVNTDLEALQGWLLKF